MREERLIHESDVTTRKLQLLIEAWEQIFVLEGIALFLLATYRPLSTHRLGQTCLTIVVECKWAESIKYHSGIRLYVEISEGCDPHIREQTARQNDIWEVEPEHFLRDRLLASRVLCTNVQHGTRWGKKKKVIITGDPLKVSFQETNLARTLKISLSNEKDWLKLLIFLEEMAEAIIQSMEGGWQRYTCISHQKGDGFISIYHQLYLTMTTDTRLFYRGNR